MKIQVFTDGSCEPFNPHGHAHCGAWIKSPDIEDQLSKCIGTGEGMSNNVAEYEAVNLALEYLLSKNLHQEEIDLKTDSMMLVNQMSRYIKRQYRQKSRYNGMYAPYALTCQELIKKFPHLTISWIPREQNEMADSLSRCSKVDDMENNFIAEGLQLVA